MDRDGLGDPTELIGRNPEYRDRGTEVRPEKGVVGWGTGGAELSGDPASLARDPAPGGSSYQPMGVSRFCSSSHFWSGAK